MNSIGRVVPEREPEPTDSSYKEASGFARGDLQRYESRQTHLHWAGILVFWTVIVSGIVMFLIWAWHLIAPAPYRFLSSDQLNDLQRVLLAAVGSSTATQVSRKWIGSDEADRARRSSRSIPSGR